jgi:hypothetical protein
LLHHPFRLRFRYQPPLKQVGNPSQLKAAEVSVNGHRNVNGVSGEKEKGRRNRKNKKERRRLRRAEIFPRLRLSIRLPRHRSTCASPSPRTSPELPNTSLNMPSTSTSGLEMMSTPTMTAKAILGVMLAGRSMVLPLLRCLLRKYIPEKPKERRLMVSNL